MTMSVYPYTIPPKLPFSIPHPFPAPTLASFWIRGRFQVDVCFCMKDGHLRALLRHSKNAGDEFGSALNGGWKLYSMDQSRYYPNSCLIYSRLSRLFLVRAGAFLRPLSKQLNRTSTVFENASDIELGGPIVV